jgi:hypothetical protein
VRFDGENEFLYLLEQVAEERATPDELSAFNAKVKADSALRDRALDHLWLQAVLEIRGRTAERRRARTFSRADTGKEGWRRIAAAVAVLLLGGIAVWRSVSPISDFRTLIADLRLPTSGSRPPAPVSPVTLVSQSGVRGLDLPSTLPGMVRLTAGEIVVRLGSGVRLTVLGPASLDIRDVMQVSLERGRLLANVPHWATGFVARTADLEVCDLGTVFSVAVDWPVSDVFVFKGRVRVNEAGHGVSENPAPGDVVGICEAGEGVRAEAGERPVKFAADWPAAKKAFASVRDSAAAENPAAAFVFAEKIADLWMDGSLSRELARVEARRAATASAPKIPFRKTAWVRPAASVQQEAGNMKATSAAAVLTAATMAAGSGSALSAPVFVNTFPDRNRCWETVYTNAVPLAWNWNWVKDTASSVQMDIVGMNGSVTTNFASPTTNWVWQAFAQSTPSAEDVYALTLTFYNGGGSVVGVLTSRLAVVNGAFGKALVDPVPSSAAWSKVKDNSVIPVDAGWTEATASAVASRLVIAQADGRTVQTNALADAGGYFGWKLKHGDWGYGTFNLALTFPGTVGEWDATLTRPMDGTLIRMQ